MFTGMEFVYNGVSSLMYGLMIYELDGKGQQDVSFGNKASIIETRTTGRVKPIHYGVNYHEKPLEFKFVFGAEHYLDRYELQDIALFLTGSQDYGWLSIGQPDMEHIQYRCIFTELKPLNVGGLPVAFEATVLCDGPYAYGYPFSKRYTISGATQIVFRNDGTVWEYLKPTLTFSPASGTRSISVVNESDNGWEFRVDSLPSGCILEANGENGTLLDRGPYGYNLVGGFNAQFFRLVRGENRLLVTGNGTLVISGRFLYNVAA